MNICLRIPGSTVWSASVSHVTPAIRDAYTKYKERHHYYRETPYLTDQYIVYRPENDPYLPTYIAWIADIPDLRDENGNDIRNRSTINSTHHVIITQEIHDTLMLHGRATPILDIDDISVFIVDNPAMGRANWVPARAYQIWAYRDFMYDPHRSIKKSYMSRDTSRHTYESNDNILANQIVTIDVANIAPNIVFNISRNDNNSVYFERNDAAGSRVRICDNEFARAGYLGFYTRLTMDPGIVTTLHVESERGYLPTQQLSIAHLPDPEEIDDDGHADQCILCVKYRVNARFSPCEHQVCCGLCYSKMAKNECPVCRAEITRVMNL
jgi:hypothetical protein